MPSSPKKSLKLSSLKDLIFTFWNSKKKYKNYFYSTGQQRITFRRTLQILLDENCKWEYDSFGVILSNTRITFLRRELHFSDENYF